MPTDRSALLVILIAISRALIHPPAGLVAQQQCVGPVHTPLADNAVIALSYFEFVGAATSIGEQPVKGLISAAANARMSVAEALTNLSFVCISSLEDVKCSGNWMWPAKLPGKR